ncbi:MAG: L,D-transpeptidase family protein [Vulcanimicrobiota bacterium]
MALLTMRNFFYTILIVLLFVGAAAALPQPVGKNVIHRVTENDTIFTVSRQYGLAPDHVLWANDIKLESPLTPGQELLIPLRRIPPFTPRESTAIVLNLPERMLYLFRGGQMVKFWGVAIGGPQYPTPDGDFRIMQMEKNPTWEPPKWLGKPAIGPGPDNPLGDRWLQITPDMVGIHGTNNPDSIGGVASLGCVRLYPEAIRSLYDQVAVGTPVYAIYEQARLGQEQDGSLVWTFFPDPYTKYYSLGQARAALEEARRDGHPVVISDFEIRERARDTNGLVTPLYGIPLQVESAGELPEIAALKKPTGEWLNSQVLSELGFEVEASKTRTVVRSSNGKTVVVTHAKIPLNPHRLPKLDPGEELELEGHRWNGSTWLPIPMTLEFLEIPHKWDKNTEVLDLK